MLKHVAGDLFAHNGEVTFAHSCNPFGLWGGGIAVVFKKQFPSAYKAYARHCQGKVQLGSCYVVRLDESDPGNANRASPAYIACLFTSDFKTSPETIVEHTRLAMAELAAQTSLPVCMPKINSGIFNVPWEDTERVLEDVPLDITVYSLSSK